MTTLCPCGSETYVDSFEHPRRPIEWFLRCAGCGKMSLQTAQTREKAETLPMDDAKESV